jgi:hypothetical protein
LIRRIKSYTDISLQRCTQKFTQKIEALEEGLGSQNTDSSSQGAGPQGEMELTMVLRLNQETRALRLHVHDADCTQRHLTSRSSGHRVPDLCDHPRSSTPGLLLLPRSSSLHAMPHLPPAHHETSKHNFSKQNKDKRKTKQNYPRFEFKPRQGNDSSQSNQGTDHLVSKSPP